MAVSFILLCVHTVVVSAEAQDTGLINPKAARVASSSSSSQSFSIAGQGSSTPHLRVESIDDYIRSRNRYENLIARYKGALQINDYLGVSRSIDFDEDGRLARSVLMYQSARSLSRYLLRSPIGLEIKQLLKRFKKIEQYTTMKVAQSHDGGYNLTPKSSNSGEKLLELKLHTSARDGIEPRVNFTENLRLAHDFFREQTRLEYGFGF